MECEAFRDGMLDVLYGEADDPTRRRFEQHAGRCDECRAELTDLRRLRKDLSAWTLPRSLQQPRRSPIPGRWRPLLAAAILLAGLGGAFGLSGSEMSFER